ncbi:MAG: ribosomal RNA small subunit methyltransferase A [Deltaproteobacteria bacterium]|nr:ribosomal RNA small subunit methyltransferase A [Deltaproteobacteria bacterium]
MTERSGHFEDPRTVLKRHGLRPKRSWGQNFLVSPRAVNTISKACVDKPGRHVIEIGAGLGTLTSALLSLGGRVTAIERDREMCAVLRSDFGGRDGFFLAEADAKKFDYTSCLAEEHGVIAGNLPYQLTGQLIRNVMDVGPSLIRAVLMVQEEVANRLVATPGGKERGALSVIVQARYKPRILLRLQPTAFHPKPKVRSSVVEFEPRSDTVFSEDLQQAVFDRVVKAAFSSRRKTLRNALAAGGLGAAEEMGRILAQLEIDSRIRPERVTEEEFCSIGKFVEKACKSLAASRQ